LFVTQVMMAPDAVIDEVATAEMSGGGAGGGGALFTVTVTGTAAAMSPAVLRATAPSV
jgi:hypothetical protein